MHSTDKVLGNLRFDVKVPASLRVRSIDEGYGLVKKKNRVLKFWKLIQKSAGAKKRLQDLRVIPPETRLTVYRGLKVRKQYDLERRGVSANR